MYLLFNDDFVKMILNVNCRDYNFSRDLQLIKMYQLQNNIFR